MRIIAVMTEKSNQQDRLTGLSHTRIANADCFFTAYAAKNLIIYYI